MAFLKKKPDDLDKRPSSISFLGLIGPSDDLIRNRVKLLRGEFGKQGPDLPVHRLQSVYIGRFPFSTCEHPAVGGNLLRSDGLKEGNTT